MNAGFRKAARHPATHAGVAFLLMGGWAMIANHGHALDQRLISGAAQGAMSAAITLALKSAIEAISAGSRGLTALWAPPLACFAVSLCLLVAIHAALGTPEIAATIAVPLLTSTTYGALYSFTLWRMAQKGTR
ncbi:hypothetical protein [Oceaniglobus trochenteri]|uniref:hypothetical protein n=1 Tax=Oceaniglobus trochenteri TaxID=2763260 RepID=UPI001CFFA0E6|nr:hypothetical protein [Oceaniglobus trochenteri]